MIASPLKGGFNFSTSSDSLGFIFQVHVVFNSGQYRRPKNEYPKLQDSYVSQRWLKKKITYSEGKKNEH